MEAIGIIGIIIGMLVQYVIIRAAVISGMNFIVEKRLAPLLGQMTSELQTRQRPGQPPS